MDLLKAKFPTVYNGLGSSRPLSKGYRDFSEKWGSLKTLYMVADEKIEKVAEIYQTYLADYYQFLSFMIDKNRADEDQEKFEEQLRKSKRNSR